MPIFKTTYFFNTIGTGWSESYYQEAATHAVARVDADSLLTQRMALCPGNVRCDAIKISNVDVRRDSLILVPQGQNAVGSYTPDVGEENGINMAADALLVELVASPAQKNRKFIRGFPDGLIVNGTRVARPAWDVRFNGEPNSYRARLLAGTWRVKVKNAIPALGYEYVPITDVAFVRATIRRTGRPFGTPVGRRKKKKQQLPPAG